jgi:hypothetical protein
MLRNVVSVRRCRRRRLRSQDVEQVELLLQCTPTAAQAEAEETGSLLMNGHLEVEQRNQASTTSRIWNFLFFLIFLEENHQFKEAKSFSDFPP